MLSDEERTRIEAEVRRYPSRRAALSEALMITQETRGYVTDEALADVARELGVSAASAEAVATFYELAFRRPVGKHVILACDSVSCWIRGSEGLAQGLMERLGIGFGGTTADGLFTLLPAGCLGLCDRAPAVMIDGVVHGELTGDRLDALIEGIRGGTHDGSAQR
jgi:NADH-quinone oxidoreductase subunit E